MEIKSATISFSKRNAKCISNREQELRSTLDNLDVIICDNFSSPYIDGVLREYHGLKTDPEIKEKESRQCLEQNAAG